MELQKFQGEFVSAASCRAFASKWFRFEIDAQRKEVGGLRAGRSCSGGQLIWQRNCFVQGWYRRNRGV
jgi:hypothetical protein